jgi:hypothetical protein
MKRKEENRSVIEPSCTFFKPNKINCLPSNRVLDRKLDRVIMIVIRSLWYDDSLYLLPRRFLSDGTDVVGTAKYRHARTESLEYLYKVLIDLTSLVLCYKQINCEKKLEAQH